GRQPYLDPADVAAELPGGGEALRRVAALDRAAGVAFQLVLPAGLQLAADRQEPAGDALGVRAGVPQVAGVGVVDLADREDTGLLPLDHPVAERPADGADLVADVDHEPSPSVRRRARLPRAISVASASSGGVQYRRNRSSQTSTSRSGA